MLVRQVIYVRCINCLYNNIAKGIRLLDRILFIQEKIMQVGAFERYIPLREVPILKSDALIEDNRCSLQ